MMVFGVVIASAPVALLIGLLLWTRRREGLRGDVRACQIALTDAIHERLGAAAAPLVRRCRRGWQVRIGVPFERPAVIEALVAIVLEAFAERNHDPQSLEIVLTRRADMAAGRPAGARNVGRETLAWR
jgi:hypothetical protein